MFFIFPLRYCFYCSNISFLSPNTRMVKCFSLMFGGIVFSVEFVFVGWARLLLKIVRFNGRLSGVS